MAMENSGMSRRDFLQSSGLAAGALLISPSSAITFHRNPPQPGSSPLSPEEESGPADYTIRIKASPIEIAKDRILSTITYNGQFPGPLLRFKEGRRYIIDIFNDTDTPEQ